MVLLTLLLLTLLLVPAHRPTIGDAATRLSTLRQSLYGSDAMIGRLRHALRGAHERMVRVTGCRVFCVGHALGCSVCRRRCLPPATACVTSAGVRMSFVV